MTDQTYNGWTNYETWVTKLWIDNEQSVQESWIDEARGMDVNNERDVSHLSDHLRNVHEDAASELMLKGVFADLLNAAIGSVEWREIARSLIEDAKELGA